MSYDFLEDAADDMTLTDCPFLVLYCESVDNYKFIMNIECSTDKEISMTNKKAMIYALRHLADRIDNGYY